MITFWTIYFVVGLLVALVCTLADGAKFAHPWKLFFVLLWAMTLWPLVLGEVIYDALRK